MTASMADTPQNSAEEQAGHGAAQPACAQDDSEATQNAVSGTAHAMGGPEAANVIWNEVRGKPWNFEGWMALMQSLEHAGEGARAELREAYQNFLQHFPLCYGYWDKLARLERSLCEPPSMVAAAAVYEGGLAHVKCWELFLRYCQCAVEHCGDPNWGVCPGLNAPQDATEQTDDEKTVRLLFARAVNEVGDMYDSGSLWDAWYAFEEARHKDVFIEGVSSPLPLRLALVAVQAAGRPIKPAHSAKYLDVFSTQCTQGEIYIRQIAPAVSCHLLADDKANVLHLLQTVPQVASSTLQEALQAGAQRLQSRASEEACVLSPYEEAVCGKQGRSFFHVQPLSEPQLRAWHNYMSFAIEHRPSESAEAVCERALIAGAVHPELWLRYADYLEGAGAPERARALLLRACDQHFTQASVRRAQVMCARARLAEELGAVDEARALYREVLGEGESGRRMDGGKDEGWAAADAGRGAVNLEVVLQLVNLERRAAARGGGRGGEVVKVGEEDVASQGERGIGGLVEQGTGGSARRYENCLGVYRRYVEVFVDARCWQAAVFLSLHHASFLAQVRKGSLGF